MGKIYVITSGEYSDYGVEAVTTNYEIAKAYAKIHNCEIEEWDDFQDISIIEESNKYEAYIYLEFYHNHEKDLPDYINQLLNDKSYEWIAPGDIDNKSILTSDDRFKMYIPVTEKTTTDQVLKIVHDLKAKLVAEKYGL